MYIELRKGASLVAQLVQNSSAMQEMQFDPWIRKNAGGGHGNPLQWSCLENPMNRGTESDLPYLPSRGTEFKWKGFLGGSDSEESTCNEGHLGLIPELGREFKWKKVKATGNMLMWLVEEGKL